MRINSRQQNDSTNENRSDLESQYRAARSRVHTPSDSSAERAAANELLSQSAGKLLAFCFELELIADNVEDACVTEILSDGTASPSPSVLLVAFQLCLNYGRTRLALLFGERLLESSNEKWTDDEDAYFELLAAMAELYVIDRQPERAIKLLLKCVDRAETPSILRSAYHDQIARCYRISGQHDEERRHIKSALHCRELSAAESAEFFGGGEAEAQGFGRFDLDIGITHGDFLVWLGNFTSEDELSAYVTSSSDDWEPASPLNATFGFALLEGQGYGSSELSFKWTQEPQSIEKLLAELAYIPELPELARKAASNANIRTANSAIVFYDANRTYFVEEPGSSGGPLTYLGRFSYEEPWHFVAVSTETYPSNLRVERAHSCLLEKYYEQAEVFLRAELDATLEHESERAKLVRLKLCVVLAASADDMFQFGQESRAAEKFETALELFTELVISHPRLGGLGSQEDLAQFVYYCESFGLRLENSSERTKALEIYRKLFELSRDIGMDDQQWQISIDRCLN